MTHPGIALVALLCALSGCTSKPSPRADDPAPAERPASERPATESVTTESPTTKTPIAEGPTTRRPATRRPATRSPSVAPALPASFGVGPAWPRAPRGAAPAAYGAVVTGPGALTSRGSGLAPDLLLPRLDANRRTPLVMTPCGHRVRLRAGFGRVVGPGSGGNLPKSADAVVVLIDPGHGGPAHGAIGADGSRESHRVLKLAAEAARRADLRVGRVYLTRSRDFEATLEFRVALGDALRADVAVSVHLNAGADGPLVRPGLETYGSVQDPQGRRLAGVMYETQRVYLEQFPGPWTGDRDAGAKYRLGRGGGDYYGLLRRAHLPWVISESLFMTSAHDLRLLDNPAYARGLAGSIADAATTFATSPAPGSGWTKPYPRAPNPKPERDSPLPCVDPAR